MMDYSNIQTTLGILTKEYAVADDNALGPAINLAGFRKVWVQAVLGTCEGTTGSFIIMNSDTETGTYTPIDALNGISLEAGNSDSVVSSYFDVGTQKPWMKIMFNHNGGADTQIAGALVLLGGPSDTSLVTHVPGYIEEAHSR